MKTTTGCCRDGREGFFMVLRVGYLHRILNWDIGNNRDRDQYIPFERITSNYGRSYNSRVHARIRIHYRCYSLSFIDKAHLEKGDKVLMPASALDRLTYMGIEYPMLFELTNASAGRVSHCGVLEFVADEGLIYLPYWMMQNMHLEEGDIVQVKSASLANATYVKLQPHTTDFLDMSNPKAILKTTLRNYSCLTVGDTIMIPYNNKNYYINIVETKPYPVVSIIETDCKVDFAPLDYKEIEKPSPPLQSNKKLKVEEEPSRKRIPFSGSARRLDGKPAAPLLKHYHSDVGSETVASKSSSSTSSQRAWKLVFGSNGNWPQNETEKVAMRNSQDRSKRKEPTQAFTGRKYSLI
ncbi:ubiquitin recognition factor in ER-associated degradation protein 1-like [Hibiscus syriacus]|uniref:ubiquitin recognition factor in ER-associated degradation protein 1-like n=1 Tax=Hibiscus syriacus TaxID=106335 RepID=UPI001923AF72|nr:ubiquitin recognition factor in ER-associated degradation protein 1-like [Hibiscus syriacus]